MIFASTYCLVALFLFFLILVPKQAGSIQYNYLPRYSIIVFLLFFIGCRGFIVTDWVSYYPYYEKVPSLFDSDVGRFINLWPWEKGFILYSVILKTVSSNYFVFQFISFLIDLLVWNYIFKRYVDSRYYAMAFLLFFVFQGFVIEVNLLRNSKAFMLFLLSLKYIRQKKPVKYFLMILAAVFFHVSSIVYFPMYFILNKKFSKRILITLFVFGNIIYFFHIKWIAQILKCVGPLLGNSRIGSMIRAYGLISGEFSSYSFGIGFLERFFTFCIAAGFQDKILKKDKSLLPFLNMLYIFLLIYLYLSEVGVLVERISLLFVFGYYIVYPAVYGCLKRANKILFLVCLIIYSILKMMIQCDEPNYSYTNALIETQDFNYRKSLFERSKLIQEKKR